MPSGYASNTHKRDQAPKRKRSRSASNGFDGKDDLNYVDDDSDLSSGDDLLNNSDNDSHHHDSSAHHSKKRGRPKSHYSSDKLSKSHTTTGSVGSSSSQHNVAPSTPPSGYVSDHDESGETKVDKYGRLLGGREYKVPTFTLPTRGHTQFMFSKDPAALLGFRDSFVFLKKNVKLIKVHIDNAEKGILVDSNMLRSTFRTREISVVTARSVFKQFGHRVVRKGRKGRDDYYYTEEADYDDDPSDDDGLLKEGSEKPALSSLPLSEIGRNNLSHKLTAQDTHVDRLNYLHHAAVSARQFNTSLFTYRRANPTSYDLLTNVYHIPENRQTLRDTGSLTEKKDTSENTLQDTTPMQVDVGLGQHM